MKQTRRHKPHAARSGLDCSAPSNEYSGRFIRDIYTGELRETVFEQGGSRIIARGSLPYGDQTVTRRRNKAWDGGKVSRAMSIKPEEATPERVAQWNDEARRHGTGAEYAPDGTCYLPTRGSRAKELRRRGLHDGDGCYGEG